MKRASTHDLMVGFGERLQMAMEQVGYTQTKLANEVGLSQPEISNYIKNKAFPRFYHLQRISFILNVSYSWLKSGKGKMSVNGFYPHHEFWETVAERIVYVLMVRFLRPIDIEASLSVTNTTLSNWIEGTRNPSFDNLIELCKLLNVDPRWIAGSEKSITNTISREDWLRENYLLLERNRSNK